MPVTEIYRKHKIFRKKPKNLIKRMNTCFPCEFEKYIQGTHLVFARDSYILNDIIFSIESLRFYNSYTIKAKKVKLK